MDRHPDKLICLAKQGDTEALNELLGLYRNYLNLIARYQVHTRLRTRVDASDLTQEVMLAAFRGYGDFVGTSERELTAWLRSILVNKLTDHIKHHRAERRDLRRDVTLDALHHSSQQVDQAIVSSFRSPSSQAVRREHAVLLADALAQLSPDHREILMLRHVERLNFADIAQRMNRTEVAARKLWTRAIESLRRDVGETL